MSRKTLKSGDRLKINSNQAFAGRWKWVNEDSNRPQFFDEQRIGFFYPIRISCRRYLRRPYPLNHIFGFILLILIASCALGQTVVKIDGRILNATGQPLAGAEVIVEGTAYGAVSDVSGYYKIENVFNGSYNLIASYTGYTQQRIEHIIVRDGMATTINFTLRLQPFETPAILVRADRPADQRFQSQIRIDAARIRESGARTLDELIAFIPGMTLTSSAANPNGKSISIRGSESNQVLVLLDGIPLNDPYTGTVDLRTLPIYTAKEIVITKGGAASTYGNGAIGGVIDIISQDRLLEKMGLNTSVGSFGRRAIRPVVSGQFNNLSYSLMADYEQYDGDYPYNYEQLDGTRSNATRINNDLLSKSLYFNSTFKDHNHQIGLKVHILSSDRGLPGVVFTETPYSNAKTNRLIIQPHLLYTWDNDKIEFNITHKRNLSEFINRIPTDAPAKYRSVPPYHTDYRIISNRYQIRYQQGTHFSVTGDYLYDRLRDQNRLQFESGALSWARFRQYGIALKRIWSLSFFDWLSTADLNTALRYDHIASNNASTTAIQDHLSPQIGIYAAIGQEWLFSFFANWGRSFRTPTLADLFYQDFRVKGNADLKPELSSSTEGGLHFSYPFQLGNAAFSVTYFEQQISNLIHWELGSFATWQPFNTDAAITGFEYELTWEMPHNLGHIKWSDMFLNPRNRKKGLNSYNRILTYRARKTAKLNVVLNLSRFTLRFDHIRIGPRFVTTANTVELPAYTLNDILLRYSLPLGGIRFDLSAAVHNLFDERYELIERGPLPGRNWRISVQISKE